MSAVGPVAGPGIPNPEYAGSIPSRRVERTEVAEWELIEGDGIEMCRGLATSDVAALVTDPPYGIGYKI